MELHDPAENHVSLHAVQGQPNSADEEYSLLKNSGINQLTDGNVHSSRIKFEPQPGSTEGFFTVQMDTIGGYVLNVSLDLQTYPNMPSSGTAWLGFTASSGPNGTQAHYILTWSYQFRKKKKEILEKAKESILA